MTDPRALVERDTVRFAFLADPWENSRAPTIVRDDPKGGDPHILGAFSRVHNPDALYELCRLANDHLPVTKKEAPSIARFCRERAGGYGALRKSSLTAMALDQAAAAITRLEAENERLRGALERIATKLWHSDAKGYDLALEAIGEIRAIRSFARAALDGEGRGG